MAYTGPLHGRVACQECHRDVTRIPHHAPTAGVDCTTCHQANEQAGLADPAHATRFTDGRHGGLGILGDNEDGPGCPECHGAHDTRRPDDPQSRVHRRNLPDTCATCHADRRVTSEHGLPATTVTLYRESVHGRLQAEGQQDAATCSDCHGVHVILPASDPRSGVNRHNVPHTCAQCHEDVYAQYKASIHGQAVAAGNQDAPVCTDCHGEHTIRRPTEEASSVHPLHVAQTCSGCHANEALNERYGLPPARLSTYARSYHGVANRYGDPTVADCASCHEAHLVLPSDDPRSSVNPANVPETCGQCHEGATANFAKGTIHLEIAPDAAPSVYYTHAGFKWLTIGTMTALIGHIMLDLYRRFRRRRQATPRVLRGPAEDEKHFRRFTYAVLHQHAIMFVSVLLLILTGIPLKFPDWVVTEYLFGLPRVMRLMGFLHRVGAAGLIGVSVFHVGYLAFSADGRHNLRQLMPRVKDVKDVVTNVLYFFGFRSEGAKFGRFSYIEKFDYWAVYWGCVVMIGSGAILWFFVDALRLLPKWAVDVAHAAHSEEALLATLAIVIWHFYNVHFCPDHFPFSWTWNTGEVTEEYMASHHPLELEDGPQPDAD